MSRIFAPITVDELKSKITACMTDEYMNYSNITPLVEKDLSKIEFDTENITRENEKFGPENLLGYNVLDNGMSYYGVLAGGDWQDPVYFIIYFDGKNLRGYIPKNGNLYNTDTKKAYGDDQKADLKNARKRWKDDENLKDDDFDIVGHFDYDEEEIKKDIMNRIVLKGKK